MVCHNDSPMVVVLSGSMEPGMYRGDILILVKKPTIEVGDVIVYKIDTDPIPIVHRIASIQDVPSKTDKKKMTRLFLSKGDNNPVDDRGLYPKNKPYLDETNVVAHVWANIPYSGYLTLLMNDYPIAKYTLIGLMFVGVLVSKDPG